MKLKILPVALALFTVVGALPAADTLDAIYKEGLSAYESGDLEMAIYLLKEVEYADPRHKATKLLLAKVKAAMPADGVSLKKKYTGVQLAKVEVADATLAECLELLTILAKDSSGGRIKPNFILQAADKADAKITLNLKNVPLTTAIEYTARLAGVKAKWEKYAVVLANPTDLAQNLTEKSQ